MKVTALESNPSITLVILTGRLDTTGVTEIREGLADVIGKANQSTIIDLSQIDFIGSSGLGLLLASGKRLAKTEHQLILLNPTEMVEAVLRTTRLDQVMPILHDLDEAIQRLGGVRPSATAPHTETREHALRAQVPESTATRESAGVLKLAIENRLSELKGLNATLAQFLREHSVPQRAVYAVNVAIDELVVNVIRYAYVDDEKHLINIEVAIEGEQIILLISDDGRPCDPRKGPELDLHAEDGEVAALSLMLVLEMVDVLKYRRVGDMNRVEVRIHLFPEDELSDSPNTAGGH